MSCAFSHRSCTQKVKRPSALPGPVEHRVGELIEEAFADVPFPISRRDALFYAGEHVVRLRSGSSVRLGDLLSGLGPLAYADRASLITHAMARWRRLSASEREPQ